MQSPPSPLENVDSESRRKKRDDPTDDDHTSQVPKKARVETVPEKQIAPAPSKPKAHVKKITSKPQKSIVVPKLRKTIPTAQRTTPAMSFASHTTRCMIEKSGRALDSDAVSSGGEGNFCRSRREFTN